MKRKAPLLLLLLALTLAEVHAAKPAPKLQESARFESARYDFEAITVAEAIQIMSSTNSLGSFVLSPELVADKRIISFRWNGQRQGFRAFFGAFVGNLGYTIRRVADVDFVEKQTDKTAENELLVYRPKHREPAFLTSSISDFFSGQILDRRTVQTDQPVHESGDKNASPTSATGQIQHVADVMVLQAPAAELAKARKLLAQLDVPLAEVLVRAHVYEVATAERNASAIQIATSLFGKALSLANVAKLDNSTATLNYDGANFDLLAQVLDSDSRFKVVSSPLLRVRSGASSRFSVGSDVPVLGAIVPTEEGKSPVQSINYKSSGVIFEVSADVLDQTINLHLDQQISNFARTETGVDASPTLIKRQIVTDVSAQSGGVVLLGGLKETKNTDSASGLSFLPDWLKAKQQDQTDTEIFVLLQVQKL